MHFSTKSYLKSNRNHTAKQTLSYTFVRNVDQFMFLKNFIFFY